MRLTIVGFIIAIVCVASINSVEGRKKNKGNKDGSAAVLKGKPLYDKIEKQLSGIRTVLKCPSKYTEAEVKSLSARWAETVNLLTTVKDPKSVPRKQVFDFLEVNVKMLAFINVPTLKLYENENFKALLKHFGGLSRSTTHQIESTKKARRGFEENLQKKMKSISIINADEKKPSAAKAAAISGIYSRVFNEVTTFLQVDDLRPKTAIEFLELDEELRRKNPPVLNTQTLAVRHHPRIEEDIGTILNHLNKDNHHEQAQRYIRGLHKHYHDLHHALLLAHECSKGNVDQTKKDHLIKVWIEAMKKNYFYIRFIDGFTLSADNQMRFHTVQKLIHNIDYVHANPTVQQLYTAMAKEFTGYGAVFDKNVALMEELHKVLKNKSIDAKTWYKVCNTLTLPNMEDQLSSQYIFEVLKADLEFIDNDKIMSKKTSADRLKLLPALRHAANSMYIRAPGSKETIIYKPFKDALTKFEDHIQDHKLKDANAVVQNPSADVIGQVKTYWDYCELLLAHYEPYFTDFVETLATQQDIADVHDRVEKWAWIRLGHVASSMNEIHLNTSLISTIDELNEEVEEHEANKAVAGEHNKDGNQHAHDHHDHDHEHHDHEHDHEHHDHDHDHEHHDHEHDHEHHDHDHDHEHHDHDHDHEHHHHDEHKDKPCTGKDNDHKFKADSKHSMCELLIHGYTAILKAHDDKNTRLCRGLRILIHKYEHIIVEKKICTFGTSQMASVDAFHEKILKE